MLTLFYSALACEVMDEQDRERPRRNLSAQRSGRAKATSSSRGRGRRGRLFARGRIYVCACAVLSLANLCWSLCRGKRCMYISIAKHVCVCVHIHVMPSTLR